MACVDSLFSFLVPQAQTDDNRQEKNAWEGRGGGWGLRLKENRDLEKWPHRLSS